MDTATFLARVVAPGNYLALCFKGAGKPMASRFFIRDAVEDATSFIRWADGKGMDVWYGLASYKLAEPKFDKNGNQYFKGERTQANADKLSCLWYDADVSRPGDGKDPARCFPSIAAVEEWVDGFKDLLQPNLWVRSGYGVHLYWVFDQPLPKAEWQLRAERLKAGLIANNARGDIGLTTDAARILRPPNTRNHKVPSQPAPVVVLRHTLTEPTSTFRAMPVMGAA